ncbi:hypothetical protein NEHOM01_2374 [Nematocida homosporus]|uniref:uncharacterized protein n=1 Tax=Nematocida homosporus TaxID=1912981 RepID=UPI00222097D7|nr:uncharacterized protein NEHOM01_2374 [Nematocida homosporus]KAI5187797.1 hypothetical protein NEHOM01_2374 [Nematocida homosporus]
MARNENSSNNRPSNRSSNRRIGFGGKKSEEPALDLEASDYSSEGDYEPAQTPEAMELDNDDVYNVLETIELEWPSLTVCLSHDQESVYIEATPDQSPLVSELTQLSIDISRPSRKSISKLATHQLPAQINRVRAQPNHIVAITDQSLSIFTNDMQHLSTKPIKGGFALAVTPQEIFYGNGSQVVLENTLEKDAPQTIATQTPQPNPIDTQATEVFSLCPFATNTALVATTALSVADFRSGELTQIYQSTVDINAVAYNSENHIIIGDDTGTLTLFDKRASSILETISFHRSPITHLAFATPEVFASSSDCEVVLWDTSFTEEWEYHKYLNFVHQGQRYYKDFAFIADNTLITTSLDGLCLFTPGVLIEE